MPVAAIPFKSPPPFELPPHVTDALRELPLPEAAAQVLDLLLQTGSGDALIVDLLGADGALHGGPAIASEPRHAEAVEAIRAELAGRALAPGSEAGKQDFVAQAIAGGKPVLMMGEVAEGASDAFPASFRRYLLAGQPSANLGFLYVFPLIDKAGQAHGAIVIHRTLANGPLNHDQPAIAHALVEELANRAAA